MKKLLALAIVLAIAVAMILTKPTPEDIASAPAARLNYIVINKDKMPRDFVAAVAAAALIQGVQQVFSGGNRDLDPAIQWRTDDLIFLTYSNLMLANVGSLKCLWLLRSGFCSYISH